MQKSLETETIPTKTALQRYALGSPPAFFFTFGTDIDATTYVDAINTIRDQGGVSIPRWEGLAMTGVALNDTHVDTLTRLQHYTHGKLSFGMNMPGDDLVFITNGSSHLNIGHTGIFAAARGLYADGNPTYHMLDPQGIEGHKGTRLRQFPSMEGILAGSLPHGTVDQLRDVVKVPFCGVTMMVDTVGSSKLVLQENWKERNYQLSLFFTTLEKELLRIAPDMLFGESIGESLLLYTQNVWDVRHIGGIINHLLSLEQFDFFSVKTVGKRTEANLYLSGNIVVATDTPTDQHMWHELETQHKQMIGRPDKILFLPKSTT